mmetsp:Transcript_26871/g.64480  ORF Transcript_26871/g.64480 Transcript_26871/m.64480 type:complete len:368 (+) Transcript_26871:1626-2729(+)
MTWEHTSWSVLNPARASSRCSSKVTIVFMTRTLSSMRLIDTSCRKNNSAVMSFSSSPLYFLMACISLGLGRRLGMNWTRSPTILQSGSRSSMVSASERKVKSLKALRLIAMLLARVRSSSLAISLPASPSCALPFFLGVLLLFRFWNSSSSFLMSDSSGLIDASFRFLSSVLPKMLCSSNSGAKFDVVQWNAIVFLLFALFTGGCEPTAVDPSHLPLVSFPSTASTILLPTPSCFILCRTASLGMQTLSMLRYLDAIASSSLDSGGPATANLALFLEARGLALAPPADDDDSSTNTDMIFKSTLSCFILCSTPLKGTPILSILRYFDAITSSALDSCAAPALAGSRDGAPPNTAPIILASTPSIVIL